MTPPRWLASIFTPQNKPVELEAGCFEELFEQNWEPVCRLLFRLLGDWDEAEDLALEAFLELHRNPPRENQNLPGWLYRVALNRGLNALRARDRRRRYELQSGLEFTQGCRFRRPCPGC